MRTTALWIWLVSLGLQLEILVSHMTFNRVLIGTNEDFLIFFGVVPIQALLLVLWFLTSWREVDHDVLHQRSREDRADWGQVAETPDIRGEAIGGLVTALQDRIAVMVSAYRRFASGFTFIAIALIGLVIVILVLAARA